ncbi:MAG: enoyl-CoA hydratase-related protein, partial [Paracoccaceae bacterium]
MEYQTLIVDLKDNIGCIRLNRPDVMNALNTQMRAEIADAVTRIAPQVRVVVLTGTGRAFCSGQDLGDRSNAAQVDMERTLRDEYEPMLRAITDCPVPTITALNGAAAGAGANLALAADVVIASKSSYLMQAFTRIGLIPDAGGTYIM